MNSERRLDRRLMVPAVALLATVVIGAEAVSAQRATATRSSGGSSASGDAPSRGSSGTMSRTSSSTSGARATPSSRNAGSAKPRASNTRRSTPASRGKSSRRSGYRPHRYDIGLHFGYGGYYRYSHGYYYPYYYHPFYWGVPYYVPRRAYSDYRLGAFDLNVRPKKAEVYLDGQFIGTAGRYDGFPDHLWLAEGSYELIFYRPGLGTERRVLSIYPGVVVDVRLNMQPGESIPPAELSQSQSPESGAMAEVKSAYERQQRQARQTPAASAELDTRAEPGRVRLSVRPADASVYLDGRLLGSGDELARLHAGLVVEAGSHLLEVVRPGYATVRREFAVEEGGEVELEVLLEAG